MEYDKINVSQLKFVDILEVLVIILQRIFIVNLPCNDICLLGSYGISYELISTPPLRRGDRLNSLSVPRVICYSMTMSPARRRFHVMALLKVVE